MEKFKTITIKGKTLIIGNKGTVKRENGKKVKTYINHKGYLYIRGTLSIHRLVAIAWIPNPYNKPQVNHKDSNKQNNYVENLEWVTMRENKIHADMNGLSNSSITFNDAVKIRKLYNSGDYTYFDLAELFKITYSMVGYIVRNKSWYDPNYIYVKKSKIRKMKKV